MKKTLILLLAAALLLSACGGNGNPSSSSGTSSQESSSASSPVEEAADPEAILAPALEAYGWFNLSSLPSGPETANLETDGSLVYQVNDPRFPTYDSLKQYISGIFSQEIVDELLAGGNYMDVDGKLYTHDGARGGNIYLGGVTYAMGEETDARREIIATAEYLVDPTAETPEVERTEEYTFVQEKVDGNWIFTQFPYFF